MIDKENSPMEYFVYIKKKCPYCKSDLGLITTKEIGEYGLKSLTYFYCSKCDKMFERKLSPTKELQIGVSVRQLSDAQKEEMKRKYEERLNNKNGNRK